MTPIDAIDQALRRFDRRRRRLAALRGLMSGLAAAGAWLLLAAAADRVVRFSTGARAASEGVVVLILLATVAGAARIAFGRRFDAVHTAMRVEAADGRWGERLVTTVTQARLPADRRGSDSLNAQLAAAVAVEVVDHPPARQIRRKGAGRAGAALTAVVVAWLIFLWASPAALSLLKRQVLALADLPPVTAMRIDLAPHPDAIPQGQPLTITADLTGGPGPAVLEVGPSPDRLRPVPMDQPQPGRYEATLLSLQQDLIYRVTAGDATAGPVSVRVLRRPGVAESEVHLQFPDGRQQESVVGDTAIRVPTGTRVRLRFRATEPLRSATLRAADRRVAATAVGGRQGWEAVITAEADATWAIDLNAENGVTATVEAALRLRVDR